MAYENQRAPAKKNALDNRKLCLFAKAPNNPKDSDRQAILMWNVYSNNPRVSVFTGDPTDNSEANNKGRISANLDGPIFYTFLEMLESVAKSKVAIELKVINKNYSWLNGKRSDEPSIVSELHVAKEEDGGVWISVEAQNRPKIKFYITPSDWHQFCYADGKPLEKHDLIKMHVIGYCNLLRNLVSEIMVNEYTEPVQRANDQDYNRSPKLEKVQQPATLPDNLADEDIPF